MLAIPALLGEQVTGPYEGPYKPPLEVVVVSYSKAQWAASKNQWNDEM